MGCTIWSSTAKCCTSCVWPSGSIQIVPEAYRFLGYLGHAGMGRGEGEHIRSVHGEDAVLHIPGALERHAAGL